MVASVGGRKKGGAPRPAPSAEETLLHCTETWPPRSPPCGAEHLNTGLELLRRIQEKHWPSCSTPPR